MFPLIGLNVIVGFSWKYLHNLKNKQKRQHTLYLKTDFSPGKSSYCRNRVVYRYTFLCQSRGKRTLWWISRDTACSPVEWCIGKGSHRASNRASDPHLHMIGFWSRWSQSHQETWRLGCYRFARLSCRMIKLSYNLALQKIWKEVFIDMQKLFLHIFFTFNYVLL